MDLGTAPAEGQSSSVQEHLHQADDAGIVNLDARDSGLTDQDGLGQTLEEREVTMHVEGRSFKGGETIGEVGESQTHFLQVVQSFAQAEVRQAIAAHFQAQEGGGLFIRLDPGFLAGGAKDVVAMFDLAEGAIEEALQAASEAKAEDLREVVGGQATQTQITGALEEVMDGKVAAEDEIQAVLDLGERIKTVEVHGPSHGGWELRAELGGPVVEALAQNEGTQAIGGLVQGARIGDAEEGILLLTESDSRTSELLGDRSGR